MPFYKDEHIVEANKMIVTNADRIRNMTDEELATFLNVTVYESGENLFSCDYYANKKYCVGSTCDNCMGYVAWLKEKVE